MPLKGFEKLGKGKQKGVRLKEIDLSERCPIHTSWSTNRKGNCKRYHRCEQRDSKGCPARGGA